MGNMLGGEEQPGASNTDDDQSLSREERVTLKDLYHSIYESSDRFKSVFASKEVPKFHKMFYDSICNGEPMTFEKFQATIIKCCRTTSHNVLEIFWNTFNSSNIENSQANFVPPVSTDEHLILLFLFVHEISGGDISCRRNDIINIVNHIQAFAKKKTSKTVSVDYNSSYNPNPSLSSSSSLIISLQIFCQWVYEYAPMLPKILISYLNKTCFGYTTSRQSAGSTAHHPTAMKSLFAPPILDGHSAIVQHHATSVFPLVVYNQHMQGRWSKLYSTDSDGLSFNRIAHHILGYGGPTCMLISCRPLHADAKTPAVILGMFAQDRWRDSNRFYGSSETFLFTLAPELNIYRSKAGSNEAYQWLNLKSYGLPHGIGVGGSTEKFRLFIPDSLERCVAHSSCLTFESGPMLPPTASAGPTSGPYDTGSALTGVSSSSAVAARLGDFSSNHNSEFHIDVMEIWACGGDEVIELGMRAMTKDRSNRDQLIQQARKVDKAAFAENSFDQEFLLSKTFAHKTKVAEDV